MDEVKLGLRDISPEVQELQLELWRQKSIAQRMRMLHSLNDSIRELGRRGLERAHPKWTDRQRYLHRIQVAYGPDLAARVERYLADRERL